MRCAYCGRHYLHRTRPPAIEVILKTLGDMDANQLENIAKMIVTVAKGFGDK